VWVCGGEALPTLVSELVIKSLFINLIQITLERVLLPKNSNYNHCEFLEFLEFQPRM